MRIRADFLLIIRKEIISLVLDYYKTNFNNS